MIPNNLPKSIINAGPKIVAKEPDAPKPDDKTIKDQKEKDAQPQTQALAGGKGDVEETKVVPKELLLSYNNIKFKSKTIIDPEIGALAVEEGSYQKGDEVITISKKNGKLYMERKKGDKIKEKYYITDKWKLPKGFEKMP